METYWCTQKNSIIDMMNGKKIPLALSPCLKSECDRWDNGEYIQIRKAGRRESPFVQKNRKSPFKNAKKEFQYPLGALMVETPHIPGVLLQSGVTSANDGSGSGSGTEIS